MRSKICIISVYFGKFHNLFEYFLRSCETNPEIDFYIFSDNKFSKRNANNIKYHSITLEQFNLLATKKLGINININNPYKICDLRPAFREIFKEYYEGYDFWGYCDSDIVFGRIDKFISTEILDKYDVISVYSGFVSGPFCIFRNNSITADIYNLIYDYPELIQQNKHFCLDENVQKDNLKGISIKKIFLLIVFVLREIFSKKNRLLYRKEFRYQFQWFYKWYMLNSDLVDLTEVVWSLEKKKVLKPYFKDLLVSENYFKRRETKNWQICWNDGSLNLEDNSKEIFGFHFLGIKELKNFNCLSDKGLRQFTINKSGIT